MKRLILATAILAAFSLPSLASAQSAPAGSVVCHAAKSGETANATMGSTQLACAPVNMTKVHAAMNTIHGIMMKQQANADEMKQMQAALNALASMALYPAVPGVLSYPNPDQ